MPPSLIWKHFTADGPKAKCLHCGLEVSRGAVNMTTSGMRNHLANKHNEKFRAMIEEEKKRSSKPTTAKVEFKNRIKESLSAGTKWGMRDSRALRVTQALGEFIALDNQPYTVVND